MKILKKATVAIIGQPNVGKSTFLNTIFNKKVSIATYKPQTTRNYIKAIYENNDCQIIFVDTPGFLTPRHKLDSFLLSQIKQSLKNCDLVLFLIDGTKKIDEMDDKLLKLINSFKISNIFYILTKSDLNTNINLDEIKSKLNSDNVFKLSCFSRQDVHNLITKIVDFLPESKNDIDTTEIVDNDNFLISEIIREQALFILKQEVPHCLAVLIDQKKYDKDTNVFNIDASIFVEKESQKPIVIGKGGQTIKKIGTNARMELLKIFDCKIRLNLFVKVKKNWRDDETALKDLNYLK